MRVHETKNVLSISNNLKKIYISFFSNTHTHTLKLNLFCEYDCDDIETTFFLVRGDQNIDDTLAFINEILKP